MASTRNTSKKAACPYCKKEYFLRGLSRHAQHCARNPANMQDAIPDGVHDPLQVHMEREHEIRMSSIFNILENCSPYTLEIITNPHALPADFMNALSAENLPDINAPPAENTTHQLAHDVSNNEFIEGEFQPQATGQFI